jgi:hemolysin activation/secretion protein
MIFKQQEKISVAGAGWWCRAAIGAGLAAATPGWAQLPPTPGGPPAAPPASQVTPRSLAPERSLPRAAQSDPAAALALEVPEGADALEVSVAGAILDGGFADRRAADDAMLAVVAGKRIKVGDIYRLAGALQAAYVAAGFPFVRVTVPPQDLADGGTARLVLVDGFVERLEMSGVHKALREPVRRLLGPLVGAKRVTQAMLERRLTLLADVPGAKARTAIAPGEADGGVLLVVEAGFDRLSGSLQFDNRANDAFGNRQITLSTSVNGLLGIGDSLYLFASGDPKASPFFSLRAPRRVLGGGWSVPMGRDGMVGGVEYTLSRTQPLGGPFRTLDVFEKVTGSLTRPLLRRRDESLSVRAAVEHYTEEQTAPDFAFQLFRDRYVIGRLRLDYVHNGDRATWGGGFGVSHGGTSLNGQQSKPTATSRFTKLEASAFLNAPLPRGGLVLALAAQGQAVLDGVIPLGEVFPLDGPNALSAFNAGGAPADQGGTIRAGLSRPTLLKGGHWMVTPQIFAAGGIARYAAADPFLLRRAATYGLGLQVGPTRPLSGFSPQLGIEYGWRAADRAYARGQRLTIDLRIGF